MKSAKVILALAVMIAGCVQAADEPGETGLVYEAPLTITNNLLDADTETLEGGVGHWQPWYASAIARSTEQAAGGIASLRVNVTDSSGWGVSLDNWPGFSASPGPKKIGFSARAGAGKNIRVSMVVKWRNEAGTDLRVDTLTSVALGNSWQFPAKDVVAPDGTTRVWVELKHRSGSAGNYFFVDDLFVGSAITNQRPSVALTSPANGASFTSPATLNLAADATDTDGTIAKVDFYEGSTLLGTDTTAPYQWTWSDVQAGTFSLTARATDDKGGQTTSAATTVTVSGSTPPPSSGTWPSTPPARICGDATQLNGPSTAPAGAIVVPAGDNSSVNWGEPGKTFWFAPGTHTLGTGIYSQIVPADNTVFIGAPGAIIDGQNKNLYAFTQHATGVKIQYLTIRNFGTGTSNNNEGVVNHDAGHGWTIEHNTIINNDGAGVFVGSGNVIRYNCLKDNGQYGFSAYEEAGVANVVIDHNEIAHNNTDDWEARIEGCGCTGGGKFWDVNGAQVTNNWVHDNLSVGLWADTNDRNFLVEGNYIEQNNDEGLFYEVSYNLIVRNNFFKRNAIVKGREFAAAGDNFPVSAIYISESGGDSRVPGSSTLDIHHNYFDDNWGGVTLWENADRYCNSPANTSGGYCTLVGAASMTTCVAGTINGQPYYDDCRWRTKNVAIHDNEFHLVPTNIGCTNDYCARQSVLSNYGTYPSWSPYQGTVVQNAITFIQNNRWSNNKYFGPWRFMPFGTERDIDFRAWQAAPYNQDVGSTMQ
jgi:hypothetical protein